MRSPSKAAARESRFHVGTCNTITNVPRRALEYQYEVTFAKSCNDSCNGPHVAAMLRCITRDVCHLEDSKKHVWKIYFASIVVELRHCLVIKLCFDQFSEPNPRRALKDKHLNVSIDSQLLVFWLCQHLLRARASLSHRIINTQQYVRFSRPES